MKRMMTTRSRLFPSLLLASLPLTVSPQAEGVCPLQCRNGGTCKEGPAPLNATNNITNSIGIPLPFLRDMGLEDNHCECLDGYVGALCQHNYQECLPGGGTERPAPSYIHTCFHGGTCVPLVTGLETHFVCNCQNARGENGTQYVGQYCESPLLPQDQCGFGDNHFCLNGGTCNDNERTCQCAEGYTGRLCEFQLDDLPPSDANSSSGDGNGNNNNNNNNKIKCELDCWNGGICRLGFDPNKDASRTFQIAGTHSFQHCECKEGFGGVLCEQTLCPNRQCQHGADCIQSMSTITGKPVAVCDCTRATKRFPDGLILYSGLDCEYQSTSVCTNGTDGLFFCVNEGECIEDDDTPGLYSCDCPPDFHGTQCELKRDIDGDGVNDDDKIDAVKRANPCALVCENGGQCVKGVKDTSHLGNFTGSSMVHQSTNIDLEHCRCPEGFAGLSCQYKTEMCGDPTHVHVCFHGSQCIDPQGSNHWQCDCSTTDTPTAGEHCQHKNPIECENDAGFCLNGANCNELEPNKPYCLCPSNYTGVHCEILNPEHLPFSPLSRFPIPALPSAAPVTSAPVTNSPTPDAPVAPPTKQPAEIALVTTDAPTVSTPQPVIASPAPFPAKTYITPAPSPEVKFAFNPATLIFDDDFVEAGFDDDFIQPRGHNRNKSAQVVRKGHSAAVVAVSVVLIIMSATLMVIAIVLYTKTVRKEREMSSLMAGDTLNGSRNRRRDREQAIMGERAGQDLII